MLTKTILRYLLLVLWGVSSTSTIHAQTYTEKFSEDSITISYKWQKVQDSNYTLLLEIKNNSSVQRTVAFRVLYYWKAQLHAGSELKQYCLKPGKTIKGKRWNLAFKSVVFILNDYLDPMFTWVIDDFKTEINEDCKPGLRLRWVPAHP